MLGFGFLSSKLSKILFVLLLFIISLFKKILSKIVPDEKRLLFLRIKIILKRVKSRESR